ncbi:cytochrome P450 4C1-like [Leptidea sinapis]|uniref:cytochrome P450 4C1-like n=1 Tax=Leptidea sinapis TaxID=189913 RepID=UPI002144F2D8|nr:cytochrome P450 4C1-like [Leptidea sinapis]
MFIVYLIIIFVLLVILDRLLKNAQFEKIPGPRGFFLVNNTLEVIREPVRLFRYLLYLSSKYKKIFRLKVGHKNIVIIYNPDDAEALINGTRYNSKGYLYGFIRPLLGDGLLLSDGEKWHHRRKILTPAFHFNILKNFYSILLENSEKLLERIEPEVSQPNTGILDIVSDYTLRSICETAMGTKLDEETTDFGITYKNCLSSLGSLSVRRGQRVWQYSDLIYYLTSLGQEFLSLLYITRKFRDDVIDKRIEDLCSKNIKRFDHEDDDVFVVNGKKKLAMLDLLLEAEKNGIIDRSGINDEVDTFMFEGHDTTATALQFTFMILANHQDIQNKIIEECNAILGSSDALPTMNDLTQMKYLDCCIKESLRMYPPVFFISRTSDGPIKLNSYECPKGTDVMLLIRVLHLRSDQFVEPYKYNPDRFMQEPTWHQFAYIPFSAGPRNCIGQKFAMLEMKLAVCMVLRRYRVLPVTKPEDIIFDLHITLRSKDPIFVKFEKR